MAEEEKPPVRLSAEEKLRRQLEKEEQKANKIARRKQRIGAQLTKLTRSRDTHKKVVAGVWALEKAERSPEFLAEMTRDLNRTLWRDDEPEVQEQRKPKPPRKAKTASIEGQSVEPEKVD